MPPLRGGRPLGKCWIRHLQCNISPHFSTTEVRSSWILLDIAYPILDWILSCHLLQFRKNSKTHGNKLATTKTFRQAGGCLQMVVIPHVTPLRLRSISTEPRRRLRLQLRLRHQRALKARSHRAIVNAISLVITKLWVTKPFLRLRSR